MLRGEREVGITLKYYVRMKNQTVDAGPKESISQVAKL